MALEKTFLDGAGTMNRSQGGRSLGQSRNLRNSSQMTGAGDEGRGGGALSRPITCGAKTQAELSPGPQPQTPARFAGAFDHRGQ